MYTNSMNTWALASTSITPTSSPNRSPTESPPFPDGSYDAIVIGAGVAGLAFVLRLPPGTRVALLTKGALGESNTRYAQGGLAAAVGLDDDPALHEADTLAAGAGLCDPEAVRRLVAGGKAAVEWLVAAGTRFDRGADGRPSLGLEAAHQRHRVLHAGGDATGAEIERALVERVRANPAITVFEGAFALDLLVAGGRCQGVLAELTPGAAPVALRAPVTVLAAGGTGQLWATTSNPAGATADGLAMALRAGVAVADLEFVQFHPTVLALAGSVPFLVSEAVRGEGAFLRGENGERFMAALDPLAELAPRDVVARGIQRQMASDGRDQVWLDLRHLPSEAIRARFPTITRELAARGLDLATDLIPVAPAAHYFIGGVVAGTDGTTSLPGLLALGEVSCTGVHGANRLASNSLLEGLVFGLAAAEAVGRDLLAGTVASSGPDPDPAGEGSREVSGNNVAEQRSQLQRLMSHHVAVVRDAAGLSETARALAALNDASGAEPVAKPEVIEPGDRARWELRNMTEAAAAIVAAALQREESRGAHFRSDFPVPDPRLAGRHWALRGGEWRLGSLAEMRGARQ